MAKNESDIFICRLGKSDYWAYPSPFVAHGGGTEIQFRNLTDDAIEIDLGDAPLHKKTLSLGPTAADYVVVNGDARAGLYEYAAAVRPGAARVLRAAAGRTKKAARAPKLRRIIVKGGSSPKIIIDT
jgi:hypothetical protein